VLELVSGVILLAIILVVFGLYYEHKEKIKEKIADSRWGIRLEISDATTLLLRRFSKYLWVVISFLAAWLCIEYFHIFGITSKSTGMVSIAFFLWGLAIFADYLSKGAIYLSSRCSVPAGDYDNPYRLLGLFVGVIFMCLPLLSNLR
jgi:membrane-associated HD superfamily phosphohydrolase